MQLACRLVSGGLPGDMHVAIACCTISLACFGDPVPIAVRECAFRPLQKMCAIQASVW